jgi:hypothetical protein
LVNHLKDPPYGPFHALVMILGSDEAQIQAKVNMECPIPPSFLSKATPVYRNEDRPAPKHKFIHLNDAEDVAESTPEPCTVYTPISDDDSGEVEDESEFADF